MINFGAGGNFWNQYQTNTEHLDQLLSKNDTPIEELLDDENIIQELKNLNPRLLNYMTFENIKKLVTYITVEPNPEETDEKKLYKFPFVSCELLIMESNTILDTFFIKEEQEDDDSPLQIDSDPEPEHEPESESKNESKNKKKGLREEDFLEFSDQKEDKIKWHGGDELNEEKEENIQKKQENTNEENVEDENFENKNQIYEIKIQKVKKNVEKKEEIEEQIYKGKKGELLDYFLECLENNEINVTIAGYFSKVCLSLFNKRSREFIDYLYSKEKNFKNLLKNLVSRSIAEVLYKAIAFENSEGDNYLTQRLDIINNLILLLNEESDFELINNIYYILIELITKNQTIMNKSELINDILSPQNISILSDKIISKNKALTSMTSSFFSTIFNFMIQNESKDEESKTEAKSPGIPIFHKDFLTIFSEKIPGLIDFLFDYTPVLSEKINTTFGEQIEPFGLHKIRIIEMLGNSLRLNNVKINQNIALQDFFTKLMQVFTKFKWNNLLHSEIEKILTFALESESRILGISVLKDGIFVEFLMNAVNDYNKPIEKNKLNLKRPGYLGHLTKIANNFEKLSQVKEEIKTEINSEKWKNFNDNFLIKVNSDNNKDIGGHNSVKNVKIDKDFDSAISFEKSEIEAKFTNFLNSAKKKENKIEIISENEVEKFWGEIKPKDVFEISDTNEISNNLWNSLLNPNNSSNNDNFSNNTSFAGFDLINSQWTEIPNNQINDIVQMFEQNDENKIKQNNEKNEHEFSENIKIHINEKNEHEFSSGTFWKLNMYNQNTELDKLMQEMDSL